MSTAVAARRPSPSHASSASAPPYRRGPASARSSAPANAASGHPAFGERCFAASRRMTRHAARRSDTAHSSTPVRRAGSQLAASSRRAAKRPNSAWRGVRWPIMLSSVLIALYAARPGRPSSAYQNSGAITPSFRFSPADSIAARATPSALRLCGSRPTRCRTRSRAGSRPVSSPCATTATASCRPRHASNVLASAASAHQPQGNACAPRHANAPSAAAAQVSPTVVTAPRSTRLPPRLNRRSRRPTTRPNAATGCGIVRYNRPGSPIAQSMRKAARTTGGSIRRPCARRAPGVKPAGEKR